MPLVKATLGSAEVVGQLGITRVGERNPAVSVEVGGGDGVIEFPLDHVVLAARRVGAKGAAVLWAAAVDAAWQLVGGAPLDASALDEAGRRATRALARFSTATKAMPIEVRAIQQGDVWILEATTDEPMPLFTTETFTPKPVGLGSAWLERNGDIAVGARVQPSGDIDGDVIYILSSKPGHGIYVRIRTADGRIIVRRPRELRLASARDVTVVLRGDQHTLAARTTALQGDGYRNRQGVASLRLAHSGCPCERLS